jgi:hypothetical protein
MSKTKGITFRYLLETKPKRFGIFPEFLLLKTDCFDLVQNLLTWAKQKGSLSIRQIRELTQSLFVSFLLDTGIERLLNDCGTFFPLLF